MTTQPKGIYDSAFYSTRDATTKHAAAAILDIVTSLLPPIRSAVDFGCGVGTWLAVLQAQGINDITGFDGPWVSKQLLQIPVRSFHESDLTQRITVPHRVDLAISLEVAEHLPRLSASTFIDSITAASDFVLFSAAIPCQGGRGHVNEQWPDYWVKIFNACNYENVDIIRWLLWDDQDIPVWYRQNVFLFVNKDRLGDVRIDNLVDARPPVSVVHPELYMSAACRPKSLRGNISLILRGLTGILATPFPRRQAPRRRK